VSSEKRTYTVRIHDDGDDGLWAEVAELPGCFASGQDWAELREALQEAIGMYLSTPTQTVTVQMEEARQVDSVRVTEQRVLVC